MKALNSSLAKALGTITVALFFAGLLFRFALYRHLYIGPGEPYGISDLIEFFLGWALIGMLVVSALAAAALLVKGPRENRITALCLLATCGAVIALVAPLHELAAKWAP